jgi:hypothetical protein
MMTVPPSGLTWPWTVKGDATSEQREAPQPEADREGEPQVCPGHVGAEAVLQRRNEHCL